MSEELRPCPFCGGTRLKVFMNDVACMSCGASGPDVGETFEDTSAAIAAWNFRTPPADRSVDDGVSYGEALNAVRPFAFLNYPMKFRSSDGGCTTVIVEDEDVQRLRAMFKLCSIPPPTETEER